MDLPGVLARDMVEPPEKREKNNGYVKRRGAKTNSCSFCFPKNNSQKRVAFKEVPRVFLSTPAVEIKLTSNFPGPRKKTQETTPPSSSVLWVFELGSK